MELTYNLGIEVTVTWEQQLLLLDSCQPDDLEWQLTQKQMEEYPLEQVYYFTEGAVAIEYPWVIITNAYMNEQNWNIDKGNKDDIAFDVQVMINGTLLNTGQQQYFWFRANDTHLIIDADQGVDQLAYISIEVMSRDPYYYVETYSKQVRSDYIRLTLPSFLNVQFVNHLAPYFVNEINGFSFSLPLTK